jgi:hypothetical protein
MLVTWQQPTCEGKAPYFGKCIGFLRIEEASVFGNRCCRRILSLAVLMISVRELSQLFVLSGT